MKLRRILLIVAGIGALATALAPNAVAAGSPGPRASQMPAQSLTVVIRPTTRMGHAEHLTMQNFAVEPGLTVTITFTNYTHAFHTFTAPGLGLSALIRPSDGNGPMTTVVTFTPHSYGVFDWSCRLCPMKGTGSSEVMGGKIYAIVQV